MQILSQGSSTDDLHRNGSRVWFYFFGTIGVLFLTTASLLIILLVHAPSEEFVQAEKIRAYELINKFTDQTLGISFPETEANIDQQVDMAFAPAYIKISDFADLHYSVTGEYTELVYAAMGQLEAMIEEILFEGLDERLEHGSSLIIAGFLDELRNIMEAEAKDRAAMSVVIKDMLRRFEATDLALKGIGGGVAGVTVTKAVSAAIAKKLITVTSAKTAGKITTKTVAGTATSAAAGAAAGSFIPGIGTAAGGIIGGIIGWFTVDKAVIELDEHFNRADFEKEIAALIDEQKALVKAEIREHIQATIVDIKSKTPLDLIHGDA